MSDLKYTVIKNEQQYFTYCEALESLVFREDVAKYGDEIELLSLLIKNWDDSHSHKSELNPVEFLRYLMETNKVSQNQLATIAGVGKSYISEILNYKKYMSKDVIRRIASHFKVQQEALNKEYDLNPATEMKTLA
jgi:HTH-type transcriptional regulator / antitoxin HigA